MNKKIFTKFVLATVAVFLGCGFWGLRNVSADETPKSSMFVSPMSQEILLIPGESYEGVVLVSNAANSQQDLKYSVKVGSYSRIKSDKDKDDYGSVDIETRSGRNEIMDWIELNKTSGTVGPNGVDKVVFKISVPKNAPAGAQYASILVINDDGEEDGKENGVTIKNVYQLASAIFANVAGENIEKGKITDNIIPSFLTTGPLETTSMVENLGNVYTDAEYILQVASVFGGDELCTNEENPDKKLVLPETERYNVQTCDLPAVGIFKAKQTVRIFGEASIVEKPIIVFLYPLS